MTRAEEEAIDECQRLEMGEFIDEQIFGMIMHGQEDDSETIGVFKQMKLPDFAAYPKGREAILKELEVHNLDGSFSSQFEDRSLVRARDRGPKVAVVVVIKNHELGEEQWI